MRIEFDTGNATELAAVAVLIEALRGDMPATQADRAPAPSPVPLPPVAAPVAAAPSPAGGSASPAPAPVPPVPAAPAPNPGGVEVDAGGLPWDKRIHSDPPTKKQDGHWRSKRGLDPAVKTTVEAELRGAMGAPAAGAAPAAPLAPSSSDNTQVDAATAFGGSAATTANEAPAPVVLAAPPAPPAPPVVPAAPPAPPTAAAPTTFAELMKKITALQTAGTIDVAGTAEICTSLGLTGVRDLMHRPDLIPAVDSLLPAAA